VAAVKIAIGTRCWLRRRVIRLVDGDGGDTPRCGPLRALSTSKTWATLAGAMRRTKGPSQDLFEFTL